MSKTIFYRQCQLRKDRSEVVQSIQVSYIPEKFCVLGKILKLKDDNDKWEDGWKVEFVGSSRVSEDCLPDSHEGIKTHRKRTGDSMKK